MTREEILEKSRNEVKTRDDPEVHAQAVGGGIGKAVGSFIAAAAMFIFANFIPDPSVIFVALLIVLGMHAADYLTRGAILDRKLYYVIGLIFLIMFFVVLAFFILYLT